MANIKEIRGLLKLAGWMFIIFGILVTIVGILGIMGIVKPESEFVTGSEWLRYTIFETTYGLVCVGVGYLIFLFRDKKLT